MFLTKDTTLPKQNDVLRCGKVDTALFYDVQWHRMLQRDYVGCLSASRGAYKWMGWPLDGTILDNFWLASLSLLRSKNRAELCLWRSIFPKKQARGTRADCSLTPLLKAGRAKDGCFRDRREGVCGMVAGLCGRPTMTLHAVVEG